MEVETPVPRVTFTDHLGDTIVVDARVGDSVMATAKRHGIPGIRGDCGGFMQCATCHVYVDERNLDGLPPVSDDEDDMLEGAAADRHDNSRLSCQIVIGPESDLRVTLPDRQL